MKRLICIVILLLVLAVPRGGLSEDTDTVILARTLYTLGKGESYETMLAIGTVIMNRVDSPWFPDTIEEVINQQHQFAYGSRYDNESLTAARAIVAGERTLPTNAVYYREAGATRTDACGARIAGTAGYDFYTARG